MAIDPSFRMTVDDVFLIKEKGTVAVGRIESGVIHPGETVEVHGQGPIQAVIVDRIEVKGNLLDEAGPGMNVGLALGGLRSDDLHAGDLLTASEGGAFAAPLAFDPSQADKLPKRAKPLKGTSELIRPGLGILAAIIILVLIFIFYRPTSIVLAVTLLVGLVVVAIYGWRMVKLVRGQRVMKRGCASTTTTIVHKRTVEHSGSYGSSTFTYHITLDFTPTEADHAPERLLLDAEVSRKFWEELQMNGKVNICYATEDPKVLLIEGE
jgi:hypothetical protein